MTCKKNTILERKKKRHIVKSTIVINKHGLIIYAGSVYNGKKHDMAMLRLDDPDLGVISECMKSTQTTDEDKPISWSNLGYTGIDDFYPGIILMQPIKNPERKKDNQKKSWQKMRKKYNKSIRKIRIKAEHAIGNLKHFSVLRNIYIKFDDSLDCDLQIISGLVNHRILWDSKEKKLKFDL